MPKRTLLKTLLKKFKWAFFFLFALTFVNSYIRFIVYFNLRNNLNSNKNLQGKFYYLFSEFSICTLKDNKMCVNWGKLLFILFLLYFPLKIIIQLILNYFQDYYKRRAKVYLLKKMLAFSYKNKSTILQKTPEKVYIVNAAVSSFSQTFFAAPVNIFGIIVDMSLEIFNLCFLISSRNLWELIPIISVFIIVNLTWFLLFNYFAKKIQKSNNQKNYDYQNEEKAQIKSYLENLNSGNKTGNLEKIYKLLDSNSTQISTLLFFSSITQLPSLIISGVSILFLFFYYHFCLQDRSSITWNDYFIANSLQNIFLKVKKGFDLLPSVFTLCENYQEIKSFFGQNVN